MNSHPPAAPSVTCLGDWAASILDGGTRAGSGLPMTGRMWLLGFLGLMIGLASPLAHPADAPADPVRGKRIYDRGLGRDPVQAELQGRAYPGELFPCVNCHGEDGRGRPEAGMVPADIRWRTLSAPVGRPYLGRSRHAAYDEMRTAGAIRDGVDPSGSALSPGMPRYRISARDMADLIAWLKLLEDRPTRGFGEEEIRVGLLLFDRDATSAWFRFMTVGFAEKVRGVNRRGGLYGRRLRLTVVQLDPELQRLDSLRPWLRGAESPAVLIVPDPSPFADALDSWCGDHDLPSLVARNRGLSAAQMIDDAVPSAWMTLRDELFERLWRALVDCGRHCRDGVLREELTH